MPPKWFRAIAGQTRLIVKCEYVCTLSADAEPKHTHIADTRYRGRQTK